MWILPHPRAVMSSKMPRVCVNETCADCGKKFKKKDMETTVDGEWNCWTCYNVDDSDSEDDPLPNVKEPEALVESMDLDSEDDSKFYYKIDFEHSGVKETKFFENIHDAKCFTDNIKPDKYFISLYDKEELIMDLVCEDLFNLKMV